MRISDMQRREPFEQIVIETLAAGWTEQYGREVCVTSPDRAAGELWLMQPLLSACYSPTMSTIARQFVRDGFRGTPVAWRRPAQWLLGSLLTTRWLLPRISQPIFRVSQALPHQSALLVMPGNQRVRVFDFERGLGRVLAKRGFERRLMKREIALRGQKTDGPFPSIVSWGEDGRWFEESIIHGYALPRLPLGYDRLSYETAAFDLLNSWLARSAHLVPIQQYVDAVRKRLAISLEVLADRFAFGALPQVERWIEILCEQCLPLEVVEVAETHGDFQPGNIMVARNDRRVWLIDWEHSRQRSRYYDHFVYTLRTRAPVGVASRLARCASGELDHPQLQPAWRSGASRRALLALLILEDTDWYAAESVSGTFRMLPDSWVIWCREMATLGAALENLFPPKVS